MMFGNKQAQKAGENSQLVQAGTVNIYNGIDEKRAREICNETYAVARRDFTADAYACANARVQKFEDSLIPKMLQIEEALGAFADPAFQFLLTSAQRTAAATERTADYDLLSELLVSRIEKGASRKDCAGISYAIEIVNKIDDDALCALTIVHAMTRVLPKSGFFKAGLEVLNDLYEKLLYTELPTGTSWIEHLDILGAVRINSFGSFDKLDKYYGKQLAGYCASGISVDSEDFKKAVDILSETSIVSSVLVPNELLPGYVRLPVVNKDAIRRLTMERKRAIDGDTTHFISPLTNQEIQSLEAIWDIYTKDNTIREKSISAFWAAWDSYPTLRKLHMWWDELPIQFHITHVGSALAHTNARRCDKSIPELPLAT